MDDQGAPCPTEAERNLAKRLKDGILIVVGISILGVGVGLAILLFLWSSLSTIRYSVLFWAIACFALGIFLGFLFGIPRTRHKDDKSDAKRSSYQLIINTNLDDVSDWFTKIVVGVGLVDLRKIPPLVQRLAFFIGDGDRKQVPLIISVLLYFSTAGFLAGYLNTRLFIQRAFNDFNRLEQQQDAAAGAATGAAAGAVAGAATGAAAGAAAGAAIVAATEAPEAGLG